VCIVSDPVPRLPIYLGESAIGAPEVFEGCHVGGCAYERPVLYYSSCESTFSFNIEAVKL